MEDKPRNTEHFQLFLQAMPQAYAHHKLILKEGKPDDYVFLDINHNYERFTGLEKTKIIGKRVTEVIPTIKKDSFDWINFFGSVALDLKTRTVEQYSEALNKWYSVTCFSIQRGDFYVVFNDISKLKKAALIHKAQKEEYASLNEEYASQNEELQSILEELEEKKESLETLNAEFKTINNDLSKNKNILQGILNSKTDGVLVIDKEFNLVYSNDYFFELWQLNQHIHSKVEDIFSAISKKIEHPYFDRESWFNYSLAGNEIEKMFYLKTKEVIKLHTSPLKIDSKVEGVIWSFLNVTEIYQTQDKLRHLNSILDGFREVNTLQHKNLKLEEYLQEVCNKITGSFGFNGALIFINHENELLFKHSGFDEYIDDFLKVNADENFSLCTKHGGQFKLIDNPILSCNNCPLKHSYENNSALYAPIFYNQKLVGSFTVSTSGYLAKDSDVLNLFKEIADEVNYTYENKKLKTEHSAFLIDLKNKDILISSLLNTSPVGIGFTRNRRLEFVNERFLEMTSYKEEEVIGVLTDLFFYKQSEFIRVGELIEEMGTEVKNMEVIWKTKNNTKIDVLLSFMKVDINGEGVLFVATDTTEIKNTSIKIKKQNERLHITENELKSTNKKLKEINKKLEKTNYELAFAKEKAEESDLLKTYFLANMSHEIRTPMNAILGFSNLLLNQHLPHEKKERYINIVHSNGNQLLTIINDIIDISKIDANQLELSNNHVNLIDLMEELYYQYSNKVKVEKMDISFELILEEQSEFICVLDKNRYRQIVINLLNNAIKFTDQGKVRFGFRHEGNTIVTFVEDTGLGIKPEMQKLIFERFRQANDAYSLNQGGTGLGLAICKSLVELMGGKMGLESIYGEGSRFYFSIPLRNKLDE